MPEKVAEYADDALLGNPGMSVKLKVFEGPLDLLLFLIRKSEIDIYNIPIASVTEQYMDVLHSMKETSLDVAGEFFVMAATLMYIKSRMLLPVDERAAQSEDDADDAVDPRWNLVEQLVEYREVKRVADELGDMMDARQSFGERVLTDGDAASAKRPLFPTDGMEIWSVFNMVLRRLTEKLAVGQITRENVTVADRMKKILSMGKSMFTFSSIFDGERPGIVTITATFLAMLELTRLKRLHLIQNERFGEIYCEMLPPGNGAPSDSDSAGMEETA